MEDTAATSGTTATETAAPSTSASVTPDQRPTMAQAFASDAATSSESTAQPEAATTQPAETSETQAPVHPSEKTGPIPFDVHKTALENARAKAVAEYKEKFGWAESVDRTAYEQAMQIGQLYQRDPVAYIKQIVAEASANPELAPLVRSEAARVLGSRQQEKPAPIEADIPVVDDQGRVVSHSFSAERVKQLLAQEREALKQELLGEIAPLKQERENAKRQKQAADQQAQIETSVKSIYEQATSELPQFKEHEQEIAKALAEIPGEPGAALYRAWAKVVLPKLEAKSQSKTLDDLKTKAAASVANPTAPAVASTRRPASLLDKSLTW